VWLPPRCADRLFPLDALGSLTRVSLLDFALRMNDEQPAAGMLPKR
jgi:hypothetical protein